MKITIFGASGTLGRVLTDQALAAGHQVTAFNRGGGLSPRDGLTIRRGDARDPDAVLDAVRGRDAVFCTLGAGRRGGVRAAGSRAILAAMKTAGVRRFICQSTLGAGDSARNLNFFWRRIMFGLLLRPAFADHQAQEDAIRASDLDWTVARPSAFTDGPATGAFWRGYADQAPEGLRLKIPRADVAQFMLAQLGDQTYLRRFVGIST